MGKDGTSIVSTRREGIIARAKKAAGLWWRCLPRIAVVAVILTPLLAWTTRVAMGGGGPRFFTDSSLEPGSGTQVLSIILVVGLQLLTTSVANSCIVSALEAVRMGQRGWLRRGLRMSPRLLAWELLIGLHALNRCFLPLLPMPAGTGYRGARGTRDAPFMLLEYVPVISAFIFYLAKMGLRAYVAVLTKKPWYETAKVTRGHYLHVGMLSFCAGSVDMFIFGALSNAQQAFAGDAGLPGWGTLCITSIISQLLPSLFAAYGLLLYHDLLRMDNE